MKNFGRALRLAAAYRWRLVGSLAAALMVALLWGGNLTAIFPCIEIVLKGRSAAEWAEDQIDYAETIKTKSEQQIVELRAQLPGTTEGQREEIEDDIQTALNRIDAENAAAARFRNMLPYLREYLPDDPFNTLVLILSIILLGTLLKAIFLIISQVMVAWLSGQASLELREQFYQRTLEMDIATLGKQGTGDLMNRFTQNIGKVSGGINNFLGRTIREPLKIAVCVVGATWVCWRLLLLTLIVAPIAGVVIWSMAACERSRWPVVQIPSGQLSMIWTVTVPAGPVTSAHAPQYSAEP